MAPTKALHTLIGVPDQPTSNVRVLYLLLPHPISQDRTDINTKSIPSGLTDPGTGEQAGNESLAQPFPLWVMACELTGEIDYRGKPYSCQAGRFAH